MKDLDNDLMQASGDEDIEKVKECLEKGANVNAKDKSRSTALHKAIFRNHLEMLKLLIEKGANVNAKDNYGATALDYAKTYHYYAMVEFLENHIKQLKTDK